MLRIELEDADLDRLLSGIKAERVTIYYASGGGATINAPCTFIKGNAYLRRFWSWVSPSVSRKPFVRCISR